MHLTRLTSYRKVQVHNVDYFNNRGKYLYQVLIIVLFQSTVLFSVLLLDFSHKEFTIRSTFMYAVQQSYIKLLMDILHI